MKATIATKCEIAKGTLMVRFDVHEPLSFRPGQFFTIVIPSMPYNDERGNRRVFSIVNSPHEPGITMATRMRDSAFKRTLGEMPEGAEVQIGPIAGRFLLPTDSTRPIVMIAGGIGIAPFISMLRFAGEQRLSHSFTLLYANRNAESAAFLDELQAMPGLRLIATMDGDPAWPHEKRMISAQFIKDYVPNAAECLFMVAGPPGMDKAIVQALGEVGVDSANVKTEHFIGY